MYTLLYTFFGLGFYPFDHSSITHRGEMQKNTYKIPTTNFMPVFWPAIATQLMEKNTACITFQPLGVLLLLFLRRNHAKGVSIFFPKILADGGRGGGMMRHVFIFINSKPFFSFNHTNRWVGGWSWRGVAWQRLCGSKWRSHQSRPRSRLPWLRRRVVSIMQ